MSSRELWKPRSRNEGPGENHHPASFGGCICAPTAPRYFNLGVSYVFFGPPVRQALKQALLALAIQAGATWVITDAAKLGLAIRAAELLLGRAEVAGRYVSFYRALQRQRA